MKTKLNLKIKLAALALAVTCVAVPLHAQITSIPNADGSDGALNVTISTNIDLSQAINGVWTSPSQKPGYGTYDSNQWAVVFKYTSVNIAAGATVTFSNHITHAPVVWLVSGNVNIAGSLNLNGQNENNDPNILPEPGPGGFRGGGGPNGIPGRGTGWGFGPGGTAGNGTDNTIYGNAQIIPLIGGSSGAGYSWNGAGGGGAILIATPGNITIPAGGSCIANGGGPNNEGYAASGGAIRLVASQLLGSGAIQALGNLGNFAGVNAGRIRLEATNVSLTLTVNPNIQSVLPSNTPAIFPDATYATVTVLSVSNQTGLVSAPADPKAQMTQAPLSDDFTMVTINNVTIRLQTLNFPTNGNVTVYLKPRNAAQTTTNATCISSNAGAAIWQVANVPVLYPSHTVIQARAWY